MMHSLIIDYTYIPCSVNFIFSFRFFLIRTLIMSQKRLKQSSLSDLWKRRLEEDDVDGNDMTAVASVSGQEAVQVSEFEFDEESNGGGGEKEDETDGFKNGMRS